MMGFKDGVVWLSEFLWITVESLPRDIKRFDVTVAVMNKIKLNWIEEASQASCFRLSHNPHSL